MNARDAKALRKASLETPTDLGTNAVRDISGALNILLADMFALYVKTKNFHWHMSGPAFPRLSSSARRTGRANLRHHRRNRRARPQDRWNHAALDRPHWPLATFSG